MLHREAIVNQRHGIHAFEYTNFAAMNAVTTGFVQLDVGKVAKLDDGSLYFISSVDNTGSPTWKQIGSSSLVGVTDVNLTALGTSIPTTSILGTGNTTIGVGSGVGLTTDSNLTLVGKGATKSGSGILTNSTAIGNGALVTSSNQVVIGNDNITDTVIKGRLHVAQYDGTINLPLPSYVKGSVYYNSVTSSLYVGGSTAWEKLSTVELEGITTSDGHVTALGHLAYNTGFGTALDIIAIGHNAMGLGHNVGDNNIAIGSYALGYNVSGINNIAIGSYAGVGVVGVTDNNNVYIGNMAGGGISGSNNTVIGTLNTYADPSTMSDTVLIGAGTTERIKVDGTGLYINGGLLPVGVSLGNANLWLKTQNVQQHTLSSSGNSIAIDLSLSNEFIHNLTENTTLANPTNIITPGQCGNIVFVQHATTPCTVQFGPATGNIWFSSDGTVPTITTTLGGKSLLVYHVDSVDHITYSLIKYTTTSGTAVALSGLTDVTLTTPTTGQLLSYDTISSKWKNTTVSVGDTLQSEGVLINSALTKSTPVDADQIGLMDSAAGNILKKLSWSDTKTALKTYFDSMYQAVLVSGSSIKTINSISLLGAGDLGTVYNNTTMPISYTNGQIQTFTPPAASSHTIAFSGWPTSGILGWIELRMINAGATGTTLTWPSTTPLINWKLKNDTITTIYGTYLTDRGGETALQATGTDTFLFWTYDGGTTIYGVLL